MNSSQEPNQSLFNQASTSIQACIECMFACKPLYTIKIDNSLK